MIADRGVVDPDPVSDPTLEKKPNSSVEKNFFLNLQSRYESQQKRNIST